ncbi:MAG TPA: hypothetical protein VD995_04600 [Azospirillum sp.]|nr:hypothetical protein [Azospirillum sp.]
MDGELDDVLGAPSAEETQYFESRGETGPAEPPPEPATPAAPPADPAAPAEPPAAPADQGGDERKYVPLAALQEERRHRQDLQRQFEELKAQLGGPKPAEAPPAPTVDDDPIAVLKATAERVQAFEQRQAEEAMQQRFMGHVGNLEAQFVQTTPDYGDAMKFMVEARDRQLQLFGVTDPGQRAAILANEARALSAGALQAGENPAARAYELAKALGYQKAAPAAPAQTAANPAEKIEALQRTAAAARSLSSGSGGAPPAELTAEVLAGMSDDEFEKLSPEQFRKAMGG